MDRLKTFIWILLALLGVAAGVAKMLQTPQEMAFFQDQMGFSAEAIMAFGLLQFASGLMLIFKKTRMVGAALLGLTLLLSSVVIFMAGAIGFGVVSLIPVLMADLVVWFEIKDRKSAQ
ncbi:MAG: hypothetical protein ACR2QS_10645 [Woeseiaceae bacterium]